MKILRPIFLCLLVKNVFAISICTSKRGLAVGDEIALSDLRRNVGGHSSLVSWRYNWNSTTKQSLPCTEFVPILWGPSSEHSRNWFHDVNVALNQGSKHVLGYNEPDRPDQANLSEQVGVTGWREFMEPLHGKVRLGSHAVSNGGLSWLTNFLRLCTGCNIDFIAVHWYSEPENGKTVVDWMRELKKWIQDACDAASGRKVWLTEFRSPATDETKQKDFIQQATRFLDSNDCVERYAYFSMSNDPRRQFVGDGPSLSQFGQQFVYNV